MKSPCGKPYFVSTKQCRGRGRWRQDIRYAGEHERGQMGGTESHAKNDGFTRSSRRPHVAAYLLSLQVQGHRGSRMEWVVTK